jgi:hypothetical protein
MRGSRPLRLVLGITTMLFMLMTVPPIADARVFVGIGVPGFAYPYPYYPYPYPYPPYGYPYPPPYPYYGPYSVPPPGWDAGHWEWRQNASGQSVRVWVPPHLQ